MSGDTSPFVDPEGDFTILQTCHKQKQRRNTGVFGRGKNTKTKAHKRPQRPHKSQAPKDQETTKTNKTKNGKPKNENKNINKRTN